MTHQKKRKTSVNKSVKKRKEFGYKDEEQMSWKISQLEIISHL